MTNFLGVSWGGNSHTKEETQDEIPDSSTKIHVIEEDSQASRETRKMISTRITKITRKWIREETAAIATNVDTASPNIDFLRRLKMRSKRHAIMQVKG